VSLVESPDRRRLVDEAFHVWAALAAPRLSELPRAVIYGDANDENVLVDGDEVVGLLDFGDVLESPVVCELAIAIVYAVLEGGGPLEAAAEIVAGYHSVRRLSSDELDVLFPLILGRLAASVTIAAERRRVDPARASWFVTEDRAWRLLERLVTVTPADARHVLGSRIDAAARQRDDATLMDLAGARRRYIGPSLSVAYRRPLTIVRGEGQYLFDDRGRPYLDLVNNVCHVGHCHPHVVGVGQRQMRVLNTNTRYLHDAITNYAARLTATLPAPLEVCYFVNSGSEANELALRLARAHTGRRHVAVVDGAYHGNTTSLVAMSPYKFKGPGGAGVAEPWVHVVPMPDSYRGGHRGHTRATGEAYGADAGRVIAHAGENLAAFFVESLLSCGGQIVLPPGYLETTFAHVRAAGALAVVDEVQVGFGRVGSHFWGFQLQHVVPDIVVMGKPIGNGHPLGAVVTTREIAASFANGMEFFSTFGGNPVSCAIGHAVLEVIERERLQERAARLGARLISGLRDVAARHPIVGDVRGEGLFVGFELVRDGQTLEPAATEASDLVNRLVARGLLLSTDGPLHNVIKIKPPLVLTEDDVDMAVRAIDAELP
jgi:4-aminobutyrate aminotransferase-like enzyme